MDLFKKVKDNHKKNKENIDMKERKKDKKLK
jgi:hypothetical protein